MTLHKTQCCAYQEIDGLRDHVGGEAAMIAFCRSVFGQGVRFGGVKALNEAIYSFYLFSQATSGYDTRPYGEEFAAYIKEHKLGQTYKTPRIRNLAFHPERFNQMWLWMPDQSNLKLWWEEIKDKVVEEDELESCYSCGEPLENGACPCCDQDDDDLVDDEEPDYGDGDE